MKLISSIKAKTIISYFLISIMSLFILYLFTASHLENMLLDAKIKEISNEGTIVINRLVPFFEAENYDAYSDAESLIKKSNIRTKLRYIITSSSGKVLLDSFDSYKGEDLSKNYEVLQALNGISASQLYSFDGGNESIYYAAPIYMRSSIAGVLFISSSAESIRESQRDYRRNFISVSILIVAMAVLAGYQFSNSYISPVLEITDKIHKASQGKKPGNISVDGEDELSNLSVAFNTLLAQTTQADEVRKDFISNVSHELRTPITSMKIISDTLVQSPAESIEVYRDFMKDINREMDHLNAIIDNLLSLVTIEKDEFRLRPELFDISSVAKHRVENFRGQAAQKSISLVVEADESVFIWGDKTKIRQLIDNLVGNAIKYTNDGGYVRVKVDRIKNDVILRVIDNGIGISEEELPYVFDRFYMADSSRKRVRGSSGIGLAISKQIVALHMGVIEAKSELGVGSDFVVTIPIQKIKGKL